MCIVWVWVHKCHGVQKDYPVLWSYSHRPLWATRCWCLEQNSRPLQDYSLFIRATLTLQSPDCCNGKHSGHSLIFVFSQINILAFNPKKNEFLWKIDSGLQSYLCLFWLLDYEEDIGFHLEWFLRLWTLQ